MKSRHAHAHAPPHTRRESTQLFLLCACRVICAQLDKALRYFYQNARGPAVETFITRLKEECTQFWENGRRLCDALRYPQILGQREQPSRLITHDRTRTPHHRTHTRPHTRTVSRADLARTAFTRCQPTARCHRPRPRQRPPSLRCLRPWPRATRSAGGAGRSRSLERGVGSEPFTQAGTTGDDAARSEGTRLKMKNMRRKRGWRR